MKAIACYPRTRSAWLANLLTIPGHSLYAHDINDFPDMMATLSNLPYPIKGVVDTWITPDTIPGELTVIDNDLGSVADGLRHLNIDPDQVLPPIVENMEAIKPHAERVYHFDQWDEWIEELYEHHTQAGFDYGRYVVLDNLYVESRLAQAMKEG